MSSARLELHQVQATFIDGAQPGLLLWRPPCRPEPPDHQPDLLGQAMAMPEGAESKEILAVPARWTRARKNLDGLRLTSVTGWKVPMLCATSALTRLALDVPRSRAPSVSIQAWAAAAKLAVELVAAHAVVPWVQDENGQTRASWRVAIGPEHQSRVETLIRHLPPAARAWSDATSTRSPLRLLEPGIAVRRFLDAAADSRLRAVSRKASAGRTWIDRLGNALLGETSHVETRKVVEERLPEMLRTWIQPGLGEVGESPIRLGLRLEPPEADTGSPEDPALPRPAGSAGPTRPWSLVVMAQAARDPSLITDAADLWSDRGGIGSTFAALADAAQERLLLEVDRAARLWPPISRALTSRLPDRVELSPDETAELILEASSLLRTAGFLIMVPPELSAAGQQRLRARLRATSAKASQEGGSRVGMGLAQVMRVRWEAALGDTALTLDELRELARLKQQLVRWRDEWVLLDTADLDRLVSLAETRPQRLEGAAALRVALTEQIETGLGTVDVVLDNAAEMLETLDRLRSAGKMAVDEVPGLNGELRPYQSTGVAWLEQLGALGLGACLADDMGLGKTVQVIAYLLRRRSGLGDEGGTGHPGRGPSLLVCPTSVLGNWERELGRFGPSVPVTTHYGPGRAATTKQLLEPSAPAALVLTTYDLLRRDQKLLSKIGWDVVVLDEAQAIKNHQSKTARASYSLKANHKLALTGTPVENRLGDLWSIFSFCSSGLLPGVTTFQKELARPIERFRDEQALALLQRLTSPFILRRTKDDPSILPDLPPKVRLESTCPLTAEQASLYQATLDNMLEEIEASQGMDRRGKVLGLITSLKQICNHPAQLLRSGEKLRNRSGKLERLLEVLEPIVEQDQAALVFTQYRVMGDLLKRAIRDRFAFEPPFIHGAVPRAERERMVDSFQTEHGPPAMIVSLKAGGTGLNLTRASHVIHFDRWWNPAVEQQATDRAHRIGQSRTVMVHTLICRGTLEERIDRMLEDKAELARLAVGGGERWFTELDDAELHELLHLDPDQAVENGS